jgi:tripartite-type tricarboxylate transporter receptor subunit TctC
LCIEVWPDNSPPWSRAFGLITGVVGAEEFPNKPVKIMVGMPAGSFTDLSALMVADGMGKELNENFIVENRPGAATNIATQNVARAQKDATRFYCRATRMR